MHVVYKITFDKRILNKTPPYYYIGSKSNCTFENGIILDKNNMPYYGSSNSKIFIEALNMESSPTTNILHECVDYKECIEMEKALHITEDVVMSPNYFNCAIATISNYSDPNFATVRQITTGKVCKIDKNLLTDEWVGVSTGMRWWNDGSESKTFADNEQPDGWVRGRLGNFSEMSNNLYKNVTKEECISRAVSTRQNNGNYGAYNKGKTGLYNHSEEVKKKMSEARKKNPASGDKNSMYGRILINNGIVNATIRKDEIIPEGYVKGRLRRNNAK